MIKALKRAGIIILAVLLSLLGFSFFSQILLPHKNVSFIPDYKRVELTDLTDYNTIFMQTGLGKTAADKIKEKEGIEGLKKYQETFFLRRETECIGLVGFFTKSDRLAESSPRQQPADIQPGDILLTLSNHSLGWRHGHAGIALGDWAILESALIGENSDVYMPADWGKFSQYAVLRLKDITPEKQAEIAEYAKTSLYGVPYKLTSGFFGPKAPATETEDFGVQCSYLVWYAYNHFGIDLDSDGGRLVSTYDLLHSPLLEVVQVYGMDPREFI